MKSKIIGLVFFLGLLAGACNEKPSNTASLETEKIKDKKSSLSDNKPEKEVDPNAKYPEFKFEKTKHEFGDIHKGAIVKHTFKFSNTGEIPLLINDIRTTCGCTTPKYTKEPIAPGTDGEIVVQFNSAGKQGIQNKKITILSNVKSGTSIINIAANVLAEPKGPFKNK